MRRRSFLLLLGGYGALRLTELWVSRRRERALAARGHARVRERGFGWMVAAHAAPFVLAPLELARRRRSSPSLAAVSLAALAAAGALRLWVLGTLSDRWNVHIHASREMAIATSGPYRYVRHPNYAAVVIEVAALPLAGGAWRTALGASLLDAVALAWRISDEERALGANPEWRAAMADKPRLWPGVARLATLIRPPTTTGDRAPRASAPSPRPRGDRRLDGARRPA